MPKKNHDDADMEEESMGDLPDIDDVSSDASEKKPKKKAATKKRTRKSSAAKKKTKEKPEKKVKKKKAKKKASLADTDETDEDENTVTVVPLDDLNDEPEKQEEPEAGEEKQTDMVEEEGDHSGEPKEDIKPLAGEDDEHIDMPDFDQEDEEEGTSKNDPAAEEDRENENVEEEKQFESHSVQDDQEEKEDVLGELPEEQEKPKKRVKKSANKPSSIDDRLTSIYENPDGSMPDMSTFQGKSKWRFIKAVITLALACALLAGVVWLGFFVLEPKGNFSEEDVILSISGQDEVQVGEEVRYRIRYRNAQKVTLKNVNLRIRYPDGFIYTSASQDSSSETNDVWSLGELQGGESGYIDIDGRLFGSASEQQSLRAFLSYEPENFSSEFQKVDTVITSINDVPIAMEIAGNAEVLPGAETAITVSFDPSALQGLSELALRLATPDQFVVRSSNASEHPTEANTWVIPIDTTSTTAVQLTGVFTADDAEENVNAAALIQIIGRVEVANDSEWYVLAEAEHNVTLLSQEVLPTLVINGSASDLTVQPGEILSISAVLKNAGDKALENVQARLVFDTPSNPTRKSLLRWADLEDPLEGRIVGEQLTDEKRRGSIAWTSSEVSSFASFAAGAEQVIDLTIPVKTSADEDLTSFADMPITALFEISYDGTDGKEIISTVPVTLTVNSDTSFSVRDDIEQNDQGKDVHTINLIIQNTFHELRDIQIETDLYGDITWLEDRLQVPAGEVVFDEKDKKLTWNIDVMPVSIDIFALQFAVVLNTDNPSQTNLTSKVNFRATDAVTQKPIVKIGDEILLNVDELAE